MSEQDSHRSKADQTGRWFPLVIYGVGILAIAAELSGWFWR